MASSSSSTTSSSSPPPVTVNGIHNDYDDVASSRTNNFVSTSPTSKPIILHLGAPVHYNEEIYERLSSQYHVIRPPPEDLQRPVFMKHLRDRTWGNFSAIIKPFWSSGSDMHPWDEELIKLLPESMKIMAGAGAGYDWVKTRALSERGIIYANGAGASTESVANTALLHLISVFSHATHSSLAARSLSNKQFNDAHNNIPYISHNPQGHTLGIVGMGLIGSAIAHKASVALGMKIAYTDITGPRPLIDTALSATYFPTLTSLLPNVDCVLLATPAGDPLLTSSTLALLPRGARVVNIARGVLINEDALADALESGHIGAAGLDVHAREGRVGPGQEFEGQSIVNERFVGMKNVLLTCHTGGASCETNAGFERLVLENVEGVLGGGRAVTAVNYGEIETFRADRRDVVDGPVDGIRGAAGNGEVI